MKHHKSSSITRTKPGFTLIELLVVIAIIALLVSILLPSLQKAKILAKEVLCTTNLKAISSATYMYQTDYDGRIPNGYAQQVNDMIYGNWKVLLAPYTGMEVDATSRNGQLEHGVYNCPEQTSVIPATNAGDAGCYGGYAWNQTGLGYTPSNVYVSLVDIMHPAETVMTHDTFDFRTGVDFHHFFSWPQWETGKRHDNNTTVGWVDGHATSIYFGDLTQNWYESNDANGHGGVSWWDIE